MRHCPVLSLLTFVVVIFAGLSAYGGPPTLTLDVVYSFTNGESPDTGVVVGTNGSFYGTTTTGGSNNFGGVYEVTASGALTEFSLNGTNGRTPLAPLIASPGGNFYGTASGGGISNNGTIFKVESNGIHVLAYFGNTNGANPMGPLLLGTNGWYYGTTFNGGTNGAGSVFAFNEAGVLSNVFAFNSTDGANPASGVIQGADGNLYGTTEYGGENGVGTVFKLAYDGALTNLASFSTHSGAFPGGLSEAAMGNFYGTTISGGNDFAGTIFEVASSNSAQSFFPGDTLTTLFKFGIYNGANPNSPLTAGPGGTWYGTTEQGGEFGMGTIFFLDTNGNFGYPVSFGGTNGALPRSGVVLGPDGNFYGTTSEGGASLSGEIYELTGFPPGIIKPPANQKYASNATTQFVVTAGGSGPLTYEWQFDGSPIPSATNSTLVVSHEQLTNSGTYTVIVSNPYGVVSTNALLTVVAPTVTIVAPPATVSNASLTISGTAADPNGVAQVLCQLNGAGWSPALGTTHWQTNVTLQPGTNTFQAESVDPLGNPSSVKSVSIFYVTLSPLTLVTNGLGSITTNFKGTNLTVGRSYIVKANPDKGQVFAGWGGTISAAANPLTFTMQSNMVVQANFVANPFIATAGTYAGLFFNPDAVAEQSAGLIRNLVIGTSGSYSGQVVIKGAPIGFTGSFAVSPEQSTPTVARPANQGGPLVLSMTLNSNEVTGTVSGTNDGGWTSPFHAEQTMNPGSAQYTLLVPPGSNAPSACPPGYGYALVTNHDGVATISGALADGATVSESVPIVGATGDLPFYASLYGNTGLIIGWLNRSDGFTGTNVWWVAPASVSTLYPTGFTNNFAILGSLWTKPAVEFLSSGTLTISNSSIALDFTVSITNSTLIKEAGSPTNSLAGTFSPTTGLLKITFGNGTGKSTTTGYAAILRDTTNGHGYFLTKTNAGAIILSP
jgi:uncharacterized repeat protein (TIGR03803 family)